MFKTEVHVIYSKIWIIPDLYGLKYIIQEPVNYRHWLSFG